MYEDEVIGKIRPGMTLKQVMQWIEPGEYNDGIYEVCKSHGICANKQEWKDAIKIKRLKDRYGMVPEGAADLLKHFLTRYAVKAHFDGQVERDWEEGDVVVRGWSAEDLKLELRVERTRNQISMTDAAISDEVDRWLMREKALRRLEMIEMIRFDPTVKADAEWDNLLGACFDGDPTGIVRAMLKKFIWQVKRKFSGLFVEHHIMLVITGPQGVGKTEFVKRLCAILDRGVCHTDFMELTDNRNMEIWRYPVLFLDEMGKASKADAAMIKRAITSNVFHRRVMKSNNSTPVLHDATLIGCANESIDYLIKDETGMRRFFELHYTHTPDWSLLNSVNWSAIWASVDEQAEDPSKPFYEFIRSRQAEYVAPHLIEVWMASEDFWKPDFSDRYPSPEINKGELHPAAIWHTKFNSFVDRHGISFSKLDIHWFGRRLNDLIRQHPEYGFEYERIGGMSSYKCNRDPNGKIDMSEKMRSMLRLIRTEDED